MPTTPSRVTGRPSGALPAGEFLRTQPVAGIERPRLTVGFIPITCASPIVPADPLNFSAKHGLQVRLRKYGGCADIRDAFTAGEIDVNEQAITLSTELTAPE